MAFLCPVRIKKHKRKGVPPRQLDAPLPGRITGSDSIDTLVRVGIEKEHGPRARMVVVHDFVPCVDDELAVKRGQQVSVLYQENDWLYVVTTDAKEGFIPYTYCLPVERSVDDFVLPQSKKAYLTQSGYKVTEGHIQQVPLNQKQTQESRVETTLPNTPVVPQTTILPVTNNLAKTSSKSLPDIAATCQDSQRQQHYKGNETGNNSGYHDPRQRSKSQDRYQGRSRESSRDRSHSISNDRSRHKSGDVSMGTSDQQALITKSAPTTPDWRASRNRHNDPDVIHDYYNLEPLLSKPDAKSTVIKDSHPKPEPTMYAGMDQIRASKRQQKEGHRSRTDVGNQHNIKAEVYGHQSHYSPHTKQNYQHQQRVSSNVKQHSSSSTSSKPSQSTNHHHHKPGNSSTLPRNYAQTGVPSSKSNFQRANSLHIPSIQQQTEHQKQKPFYQRQNSLPAKTSHEPQSYLHWDQQPDVVCQVFEKRSFGQFIVLYSYSPRQENDLAVERGEFVTVLNKEDAEWYWVRRSDNMEGFVPMSFICPAEGQETRNKNPTTSQAQHKNPSPKVSRQPRTDSSTTPPAPSTNIVREGATRLVCLYDYKAQAPDDLSVSRGQWLYADLDNQADPEWLLVFSPLSQRSGYIPRTYAKPPNFGSLTSSRDPYLSP